MPPKQIPPVTSGAIHQVPCPHCAKPNDFRDLQKDQLLEPGTKAVCDECGHNMQVVRVLPTTIVAVRKAAPSSINPAGAQASAPAQPARTVGGGFLKKLLGGGPGPGRR